MADTQRGQFVVDCKSGEAADIIYRKRRKTPCFSYGDIRRSETKFLLKG